MPETTLFTPVKSKPFTPTRKDIETIKALNRYFLLSAEQVRRLFYGEGSIQYAKARCKLLADHGYVTVLTNAATKGYVYRLGPAGLKLLRTLDEEVPRRLRLYQSSDSEYFVPHTLAINDVLIAADMLEQTQQAVTVIDLVHEKHMAAIKVPTGGGREQGVITDGILTFGINAGGEEFEQTFFLEIDMGSKAGRWKRKIRRLIAYGSGPYKKHSDTPFFTVAVITPLGEQHRRNLQHWTADVLIEDHRKGSNWEASFLFTAHPAATTPPETFWLGATWYEPFSATPTRLMAMPGDHVAAPEETL